MNDDNVEAIDVTKIMQEIKRNIAQRQKDYRYRNSIENVNENDLQIDIPPLSNEEELESNGRLMNKYVLPTSPRKGIRKIITNLVHRKIFLSVSIMLEKVINSQEQFNSGVIQNIREIWIDMSQMQKEHRESSKKSSQLDKDVRDLFGNLTTHKGSLLKRVVDIEKKDRYDNFPYFRFEEKYRGTEEHIKESQKQYLPFFKDKNNVIDLGCGRGEFLILLKENGINATGVDINTDMIKHCRENNLNVVESDAMTYLENQPDNSIGGIFAGQFIEHIPYYNLIELFKLALKKLEPNSYVVFETINPKSLFVFTSSLYLDPSHTKPLHPMTLEFLLNELGYKDVQIQYSAPKLEKDKLEYIDSKEPWAQAYNNNITKLNDLLLGPQDYAIIGKK